MSWDRDHDHASPRCPDWRALAAGRDRDEEGEIAWERAVAHLEGCELCRPTALAVEPTLVFRRLPALPSSAADVADMKRAVAALRRTRPLAEPTSARRSAPRRPPVAALRRAAALAAVLGGALLLHGPVGPPVPPPAPSEPAVIAAAPVLGVTAAFLPDLGQVPLVEDFDPSLGTLIQLGDDVVVFVAETRDERDELDV